MIPPTALGRVERSSSGAKLLSENRQSRILPRRRPPLSATDADRSSAACRFDELSCWGSPPFSDKA
jgi:hypothetical protein